MALMANNWLRGGPLHNILVKCKLIFIMLVFNDHVM